MAIILILTAGAATVIWVVELCRELWFYRYIQDMRAMAMTEQNRNRFGILRTQLVALAREEEIDVRGEAFRLLYKICSSLMRKPGAYRDTVKLIYGVPGAAQKERRENGMESAHEGQLLIEFALQFDLLCRDYDWVYRSVARLRDWKRDGHVFIPLWIEIRIKKSRSYQQRVEPIRVANERLRGAGQSLLSVA